MYGMANESVVPSILGTVHPGRRTPWVAILFTAVDRRRAGDPRRSLDARRHDRPAAADRVRRRPRGAAGAARTPVDHDHFRAPTALPWLGAATCAGLAVQQVAEDPKLVLWAGGLLLFGLILWIDRARRAMIDAWHGTSPPTLSSRSSWTGCASSSRDRGLADRDRLRRARGGRLPARDQAAAGAREGARPVGRAPAAGPRRPGLRPGQARADARDPRHVAVRARGVRQRRARLGQLGDPRAGRVARPEGALPAPAAGGRPAQRRSR